MRLQRHLRPWLAVLGLLAFAACGDDDDPGGPDGGDPPIADLTGTWNLEVTIVLETGDCAGANEPPWSAVISIDQDANGNVTASGDWHANPGTGPHVFTGTIAGDEVTWIGSYPEGIGTLGAEYTLTVAADGNSMTGVELWTWTEDGGEGICPLSQSTVEATRID